MAVRETSLEERIASIERGVKTIEKGQDALFIKLDKFNEKSFRCREDLLGKIHVNQSNIMKLDMKTYFVILLISSISSSFTAFLFPKLLSLF